MEVLNYSNSPPNDIPSRNVKDLNNLADCVARNSKKKATFLNKENRARNNVNIFLLISVLPA